MNEEKKPNTDMQDAVQGILGASSALGSTPSKNATPDKLDPKFVQKTIRTYESDLALALMKKQTSVANIAIAENKRAETAQRITEMGGINGINTMPVVEKKPLHIPFKQIFIVILGLAFIGGGVWGSYYLYRKSALARPTLQPKEIIIPSLVPFDKKISITAEADVTQKQFIAKIYAAIEKEVIPKGQILEIQTGLTATSFIDLARIDVPDIINRSINDRWMFGVYVEENETKSIFIALSTDFFQNVFAGMLGWENSMAENLSPIFKIRERMEQKNTTASTTITSYFNIKGTFSDKVIRNRDVREFRDIDGELLFLYSFINKETIIISSTESALIAIIDRIEKQTFVR